MNQFVEMRTAAGLLQEDVARALNIDRSTVAKWEMGVAKPRADRLPAIARLYKCRISELFSEDEYLLGKTDNPYAQDSSELEERESELFSDFRELNEAGKGLVTDYIKMLLSRAEYRQEDNVPLAR